MQKLFAFQKDTTDPEKNYWPSRHLPAQSQQ